MVAVAALALTFGVARMVLEHRRHQKIREHRQTIARQHGLTHQVERGCFLPSYTPDMNQKQTEIVLYYKAMEQKYLKGAAKPWVELSPDPPAPPPLFDLEQLQRDIDAMHEQMRRFDKVIKPHYGGQAGRAWPAPVRSPIRAGSSR